MLAKFNIVVAIDSNNGIAKEGDIPWSSREDMKFFRELTIGKKRNAVIMGRKTYETIAEEFRPLSDRTNVVISKTWKQEEHSNIMVFDSIVEALSGLGNAINAYDEIYIAGGELVYKEIINNYMYLCKNIYITKFKNDYSCDQFFPFEAIKDFDQFMDPQKSTIYTRYFYRSNLRHDEYQYLNLLEDIKTNGENKPDRTGVGTRSIFGSRIVFDIKERIPILTTKKVNYDAIIKELLFFIKGSTNTKILADQKVNIWNANTSKDFLTKANLPYDEFDMGPMYGFQLRHWGADYHGADKDYTGQGIDQIQKLIDNIRKDPFNRRLVLSCWNVADLPKGVLYPCHILAQFNVSPDRTWLDCQVYSRSIDSLLGLPYNIASYAILTYMIAHITNLRPRKLVYVGGDTHIYTSHGEQVNRQLKRTPRPFPKLSFRKAQSLHEIDDFTIDSFIVENYISCPAINAEIAV